MNHYTNAPPAFDAKDQEILDVRLANRKRLSGPLVGDYVRMPDGRLERFSHDWGDGMQTSSGGSFFLHHSGTAEFSGGLNPAIPKRCIWDTGETKEALFWFFHHGATQAHNGVDFKIMVPVYVYHPSKE